MEFQPPKGTRDLYGKEAKLREDLKDTLKLVFQKYGFLPLESPILENSAVLTKKSAGGTEINKEIFKLKDQGKRDLGLRFDLTVPLCRYVCGNPQIKIPFKRYNIGEVFRDGPIKLGRYRQFTQADVDVIGVNSLIADAELLKLATDVFEKLKKIGKNEVINELKEKRISDSSITKLFDILENKNSLDNLSIIAPKGVSSLKEFMSFLELFKVKNFKFNLTLARGLNYYTGTVFEIYSPSSKEKNSLAAGGRYDNLIPSFTDNKLNYGAVGISFGIDPILETLRDKKESTIITKVYIISINQLNKSIEVLNELRKNNINSDMDLLQRGVSKCLDYASKLEIPYVIFIGEKEVKINKLKLRSMQTGEEELLSLNELIKKLK